MSVQSFIAGSLRVPSVPYALPPSDPSSFQISLQVLLLGILLTCSFLLVSFLLQVRTNKSVGERRRQATKAEAFLSVVARAAKILLWWSCPPAPSNRDDFGRGALCRWQWIWTCLRHRHNHGIFDFRVHITWEVLLQFVGSVWAILHKDDTVVGLQPTPQLNVDFTLYVHEDETSREANGHHNQFCPKWPFQHTCETERAGGVIKLPCSIWSPPLWSLRQMLSWIMYVVAHGQPKGTGSVCGSPDSEAVGTFSMFRLLRKQHYWFTHRAEAARMSVSPGYKDFFLLWTMWTLGPWQKLSYFLSYWSSTKLIFLKHDFPGSL